MTENSQTCAIDGDDNLYGLGIRLGQYCLTYAMLIAGTFRPSKLRDIGKSLTIFIVATYASLIWKLTTHSSIDEAYSIDVLIFLYFTSMQLINVYPYFFIHFHSGGISRLLFSVFMSILALNSGFRAWYWLDGIDNLYRGPCDICTPGYVPIDSRIQNRNKKLYTIFAVFQAIVLLPLVLRNFVSFLQDKAIEFVDKLFSSKSEPEVDDFIFKMPFWQWIALLALFVYTVQAATMSIYMIEITIKQNHVQKVSTLNSTGQIIPFIIGLTALLEVLFWTAHALFVTAELRIILPRVSAGSAATATSINVTAPAPAAPAATAAI